ncbi:MAG: CotH kinase family protein [Anaerolineae bacterium]
MSEEKEPTELSTQRLHRDWRHIVPGLTPAHKALLAIAALATAFLLAAILDPQTATTGGAAAITPAFSHPGGYYDRDIRLVLTAPYHDAEIRFTTDGAVPSLTHGAVYTQPIQLSAQLPGVTVVRACATTPGGGLSEVVNASYVMGVDANLPILSLVMDPGDLWQPQHGIYVDPLLRGPEWERPVHVTLVDTDRVSGFHVQAGIRIHGYQSRAFAKKSFRLYFRSDYGIRRLDYPLFDTGALQSFNRLVLHSGGQDWPYPPLTNWTLMRNQLAARLAFEVDGYATRSQPAILFLNGEPWGIYQIRERVDEDFLADRYQLTDVDFLDSPESSLRETLMGDRAHWDSLMAYVEAHDLSDPAAYAYVESQVNLDNFIDYNLIQIYSANTDWPAHNVYLFRPRQPGGRWHWLFWDSDNGFGADSYSQVDSDMISHLLDYNHPETGGRDVLLFRKLLQNPDFFRAFASRGADLLNTLLTPEAVIAHVDTLTGEMGPDIAYETLRWPSPTDWDANVQQMREFAAQRPGYMRQHMVDRLGLDGTMELNIQPPLDGKGQVVVNGETLPQLPWQGIYFRPSSISVTAVPVRGYRFAGWEPVELGRSPMLTLTAGTDRLSLAPRFVPEPKTALGAGESREARFVEVHIDDTGEIQGDWFEIQVRCPGGLDLRGWRVTDNDALSATDEGSLIFRDHPSLARVPWGTTVRVIATRTAANDARFTQDDLNRWDRRLTLYVSNGMLDTSTDPWFNLGAGDNLVLLAPGTTAAFEDDRRVDFWGNGPVTPTSFDPSR